MKHYQVEVFTSGDGSHTLYCLDIDEFYHSRYGALGESRKVYVQYGLLEAINRRKLRQVKLIELGLGTGLNVLATGEFLLQHPEVEVIYYALEPFPLPEEVLKQLNYIHIVPPQVAGCFAAIHTCLWNEPTCILPNLQLIKLPYCWEEATFPSESFDVVYYDAFAPEKQPEVWLPSNFEKAHRWLVPKGILTTYCSKSAVLKTLRAVGFQVEKLPNFPFKREVTRAVKI
ncbi:MAG: tRNA (5-methylaminomethyl-2-thiouridine)(34)-methyltransferase MnmD [Cytophagales bacterium]|nr:tRNA (5-methylaminomethyl-2-thiouridine)(34)-methyltransferase MnmD [Bernardetiaceae bacterium]MDW8210132.1 tRNA (5-methylaminomethyl-2-thiouridine)(34)-methyltransferase MnmD [Cytophagales bacterium]